MWKVKERIQIEKKKEKGKKNLAIRNRGRNADKVGNERNP
jgi:hypothetical protein